MRITARSLNRSTLERQMLLERESLCVGEAVRRVVALQAQMPPSPYVALWNRVMDFDPADLDAAFADHLVVKATLMRMTLHAVHADDYPCFREAVEISLHATRMGERLVSAGLARSEADAVIADLLEFMASPRTAGEIRTRISDRVGDDASPAVWRQLRGYAPIWHAPVGGAWNFTHRPSFVTARGRQILTDPDASETSLKKLVLRYLEGFGPASVADVAQFALVQQSRVKGALQALSDEIERLEGPDGKDLFDLSGATLPYKDTPAPPRLMAMWDSVLLAYKDRSRVIPPDYRTEVIRKNGDVLPTLMVDGYVAGVWRAVEDGIEVTSFQPLSDEVLEEVTVEAKSMTQFLAEREPEVYRRYNHWWEKMPADLGHRVLLGA